MKLRLHFFFLGRHASGRILKVVNFPCCNYICSKESLRTDHEEYQKPVDYHNVPTPMTGRNIKDASYKESSLNSISQLRTVKLVFLSSATKLLKKRTLNWSKGTFWKREKVDYGAHHYHTEEQWFKSLWVCSSTWSHHTTRSIHRINL